MEVFLKNVPANLSDEGLKKRLAPFMVERGIQHWACQKPPKSSRAWITFLHKLDGQNFLRKHKTIRIPGIRDLVRLRILKTDVFVTESDRPVNEHMLSHIELDQEEKAHAPARSPENPTLSVSINRIACGHNMFVGSDDFLTFVQESEATLSGKAKFSHRLLIVNLPSYDARLEISYDTVEEIIVCKRQQHLTLVLSEAPRVFEIDHQQETPSTWKRAASLSSWQMHKSLVAHCLVYQVSVLGSDFEHAMRYLDSHRSLSINRQSLPVEEKPVPLEQEYLSSLSSFEGKIGHFGASNSPLPFSLVFQVQGLVWDNYLHPTSARQMLDIMEKDALGCKERGTMLPFTTESMKQLYQQIPYPCSSTSCVDLAVVKLLDEVKRAELDLREEDPLRVKEYGKRLPDHQAWVLKATVTPTRILLHGPDAESKNKILRKFSDHTNYFLRVNFCDENGMDLSFNPRISNDPVHMRYRAILHEGIKIAGRRFSFLGFSHSSLRSPSAWFQAPFIDSNLKQQDYQTIIQSLGKFEDIRVPAKCAARIGQAFSDTPVAIPIFECGIQIKYIPDVKSRDGTRIFSDGVGSMSFDAMAAIWDHLSLRSASPTCFQIRWAGVKGMIALDTRLEGSVICIRKESMMKFPSDDLMELGICDMSSKPLRLVLNRQMIKIMEDRGTRDEWFLSQQKKALGALRGVTAKASDTSKFLEDRSIGNDMAFPKLIRHLDGIGIDYRRDVFLKSVVEHVVMRELRLLKHKARIPVSQGITLFGVMDETGFLEEGQIYITYDRNHRACHSQIDKSLTDGPVVVTRSPALHPGDLQVVSMVTPPPGHPLLQLENCIVFSQKGSRDLPSMLSGGDLDGDRYNVIWDPEAMPPNYFPPADYPRVVPKPINRDVTREDMEDFFINFMKTDVLGLIATRHQILADVRAGGTRHPDCIKLAEMHSTAVDFSKTGIPVKVSEMPRAPATRPDFLAPAPPLKLYDLGQIDRIGELDPDDDDDENGLGRAKHKFHRSDKILGKLFRGVDEKKIWEGNTHLDIDTTGPPLWKQLLELVQVQVTQSELDIDHRRQTEEAWKIRNHYETCISGMMWQFSENPRKPISEVEVFCGSILSTTGSATRHQRDSSIKLKEETERIMAWIVKLIRGRGASDNTDSVTGEGQKRWTENAVERCWACLVVACAENATPETYHGTGKLQSFRAVAASCLMRELENLGVKWHGGSGDRERGLVVPIGFGG